MLKDPLFFLCLTVGPLVYWWLPARFRARFLTLMSVAWLATWAPFATAAVVVWTVAFVWGAPSKLRQASLMSLAVLGYLALFKYIPPILDAFAANPFEAKVILPLGISYYTFKLVHYAFERSRNALPEHDTWDALSWTTLFPAFTAGPIERLDHFLQHRAEEYRPSHLAHGATRILHGLVKKLFIADTLLIAYLGDPLEVLRHGMADMTSLQAWAYVIVLYLYAYMDFAAYSDIAIGGARLFGIELGENFDWPVLAPNISLFWKRWHMSLAGFCQAYVYMPLVGRTRNPYIAIYGTFLAMGLWHGASLHWVAWGLYHATGIALHLRWTLYKRKRKWNRWMDTSRWRHVGIVPTTLFVSGATAITSTAPLGVGAGLALVAKLLFLG
ncbi:MAG: MBOAT family O-acyltransferase [Myxococcota bacterium]